MLRRLYFRIAPLLLTLFVCYYAGVTLFPHAHEVNGGRIVHSHPYSGNAANHQHSTQQLQLISLLSLLLLTSLLLCGLATPLRQRNNSLSCPKPVLRATHPPQPHPLRGPPSV